MAQQLIPPSPVITSQRAKLISIIGPDCWNIIDDYKNSMEKYEQNFINIDECLKLKNKNKTYNLDINLNEFKKHCDNKQYDFKIVFDITINNKLNSTSYFLNKINSNYLKHIKLFSMKFQYGVQTHSNINNFFIRLDLGSHNTTDIDLFMKVVFNALITNNQLITKYFGKHIKYLYLYDDDYLSEIFKKYLNT